MTERIHISRRDIAWTYASLGLGAGINLILLPLLVTFLSPEELGLWYVFAAVGTLIVVMDLGLVVTVSRNITMAWMGAPRLDQVSSTVKDAQPGPNFELLGKLVGACRTAYLGLGVAVLALCLSIGTLHVANVSAGQMARSDALTAWIVYAIAVSSNMALSFWNPLLRGLGRVSESAKANVCNKVAQLALTVIALLAGGGLTGVAVAYLLSGLIFRWVSRHYFFQAVGGPTGVTLSRHSLNERFEVLRAIWPNSYRQGVVSVSQYVMISAPVLIASAALPLSTVASLGMTLQLIGVLKVVANAPFNALLPEFVSLRMHADVWTLQHRFPLTVGMATYTVLLGGATVLVCGDRALALLGADVTLLSAGLAGLLLLNEWATNQYALCSAFLATDNHVPMAKAYAVTATLSVMLQLFLVLVVGWGVLGLVLGSLAVSMGYNSWMWPRRAAKDVGLGVWALFASTLSAPIQLATRRARGA